MSGEDVQLAVESELMAEVEVAVGFDPPKAGEEAERVQSQMRIVRPRFGADAAPTRVG